MRPLLAPRFPASFDWGLPNPIPCYQSPVWPRWPIRIQFSTGFLCSVRKGISQIFTYIECYGERMKISGYKKPGIVDAG